MCAINSNGKFTQKMCVLLCHAKKMSIIKGENCVFIAN